MVLNLEKGNKVQIQKENPGMTLAEIGLGWDQMKGVATADLDAFMIEVAEDGSAANGENGLIYYGHKSNPNNSVYVGADNLTGAGDGYDEHGFVKFADVPANVKEVIIGISIYKFQEKKQNFGQVNNAKVDVLDSTSQTVLVTYDLSEDLSNYTAIIVGRFRREADGTFSFKAIGEGFNGGMKEVIAKYGL